MSKWLNKLKKYAPDIAKAVATGGATLPEMAFKVISDAVGTEVKCESELAQVVTQADPETMLKLTQANNQYNVQMRQLANELEIAEIGDTQHAREHNKHSEMPKVICLTLTALVCVMFLTLAFNPIPKDNEATLYLITGQVLALWGASVAYWVGTTRSSAIKTLQQFIQNKRF